MICWFYDFLSYNDWWLKKNSINNQLLFNSVIIRLPFPDGKAKFIVWINKKVLINFSFQFLLKRNCVISFIFICSPCIMNWNWIQYYIDLIYSRKFIFYRLEIHTFYYELNLIFLCQLGNWIEHDHNSKWNVEETLIVSRKVLAVKN